MAGSAAEAAGSAPGALLLLELFSGTGSVGSAFMAKGWDVVSLDLDPKAHSPTILKNILDFDVATDLQGYRRVDCIWASPPCTHYSKARTSGGPRDLQGADTLVRKTLEIAAALGDPPIFIENPYTGMLKGRGLLDHLQLNTLDYCMYGTPYRKRTAIWSNTTWLPARPLCGGNCGNMEKGLGKRMRHKADAQQGTRGRVSDPCFSQRDLYRIPHELCDEIAGWATASLTGSAESAL